MLRASEFIVIINEFPLAAFPLNDLRICERHMISAFANVDTIKSDGWPRKDKGCR